MFWRRKALARADWMVVGLGNPGERYVHTPHNLGFRAVDRVALDAGIRISRLQERALVGRGGIGGRDALLAKPLSYMNGSGEPVKRLLRRYRMQPGELLVVYDELDLPWGRLRLRRRGSAGGHNGMQSIVDSLGTCEFARLRIGVHPGRAVRDRARYVLRRLGEDEIGQVEGIVGRAAETVRHALAEGIDKAMARANRRVPE